MFSLEAAFFASSRFESQPEESILPPQEKSENARQRPATSGISFFILVPVNLYPYILTQALRCRQTIGLHIRI